MSAKKNCTICHAPVSLQFPQYRWVGSYEDDGKECEGEEVEKTDRGAGVGVLTRYRVRFVEIVFVDCCRE